MPIVKIDGVNCRLHLLKFANFYSFLYVLKKAFNNVVQIEDWDIFFPEIDRSVELNIFIGNRRQIKEWLINEKFFFTKLLTFNFEYFFIEDKNCKNIKELNIFTNVMPNIEEFKKKHILNKLLEKDEFCLCERNKENTPSNSIDIQECLENFLKLSRLEENCSNFLKKCFLNICSKEKVIEIGGRSKDFDCEVTLNSNNLKAINVIEEDILFNRDFVEPIDENNEKNSLKVYFYGTPQCDILDKICFENGKSPYSNYDLSIKKCDTKISGDTFLCFMINTGELQPKHLNLVKKFLKLFELTDYFIKKVAGDEKLKECKKNKDINLKYKKLNFNIEELTYDNENKKEITKGTILIKSEKDNKVPKILIKKIVNDKRGEKKIKINNYKIEFNDIAKAFKKSFNINFLSVDEAKEILVSSACHNELDAEYRFGSSEEDLDNLF